MNETEVTALTSIATLMTEIEKLRARLARVERENETLTEQLGFYRRRIAA